ncbi:MAG: proline racemase family protein [Planctomycetaceae bacterium]|nr:proline racemase family protein [Planctomycetaceae bacterium]
MTQIRVIDSHTGGEPTRVIVEGGPNLGGGPLSERLNRFRDEYDDIRTAVILEPRGSDVLVGALLCEPEDPTCASGVIFFNNAGYLHMCGHGTIGFVVTLAHMGQIGPGLHKIETPVGIVTAELLDDHRVRIHNVPSYRYRTEVSVDVPGYGDVVGDIAWGGNWFFLASQHGRQLALERTGELTQFALALRDELHAREITGHDGGEIDHIELFGPASDPTRADSRNFVLCPGAAYDRSPCGTGTSAKLACLAAAGRLEAGQTWRQESIVGTCFEGVWRPAENVAVPDGAAAAVIPSITGSAWVTAESNLILSDSDPFRAGIQL